MAAVLFEMLGDQIAKVTLNRPEAYNAINDEITQLMDEIVKATEQNPQIRAVILTGNGEKAFCAGADLKLISAGKGELLWTKDNGFGGFVYAKRTKPWIAAVNGFALAGGTEFCLACDLIVASEEARFGLPEVSRGLVAGAGGLFRLPISVPTRLANELILTGKQLTAQDAFRYGMINRLVKAEDLLSTAVEFAKQISQNSPNSIKESLKFLREMQGLSEAELIEKSTRLFEEIQLSDDAKEGTLAFVEKRKPVWNK